MAGTVQGEAQAAGAEGADQQPLLPRLETIHQPLAVGHGLAAGEQHTAQLGLQQLRRRHKGGEQHHALPLAQQLIHQRRSRRQLVIGGDLAQGGEHRQGLRIPAHQTGGGAAAVVLHREAEAVLKALGLTGVELDGVELPLLGGQIEAILLAAMQQQRAR